MKSQLSVKQDPFLSAKKSNTILLQAGFSKGHCQGQGKKKILVKEN